MAGKAGGVSEGGGWKRKLLIDEEDDGEVATPGARAVGSIISETVYDIINREGISSFFFVYVVHLVEGTVCLSKIIAKGIPDGLAELKINIIMIRIIVESLMNRFIEFYAIKIYRKCGGNIMQNFPRVVYIITTNLKFKFSCKKRETKNLYQNLLRKWRITCH